MPDDIDGSSERYEEFRDDNIKRIQRSVAKIDPGQPGTCELCGYDFKRVVKTAYMGEDILACGRCRDERKLK